MVDNLEEAMALRLSVALSRQVDRIAIDQFGMSGLVLMENAGRGVADRLLPVASGSKPIVILCGLVVARHLLFTQLPVAIWMMGSIERLAPDALTNYQILQRAGVAVGLAEERFALLRKEIEDADIVIDAMLGTGARGAPRGVMADAILEANRADALRVAIDLPSGLDADTGLAHQPTFVADRTYTFVAAKTGFDHPQAQGYLGAVEVLPIGIPTQVLDLVIKTGFGLGTGP
ncbi:MAG: NAD(P)H-hydrate epimerase [Pirellulaceae bacterium]